MTSPTFRTSPTEPYCQTCRHFSKSARRAQTGSEWGTCLLYSTKPSVHELDQATCHSDGEVKAPEAST